MLSDSAIDLVKRHEGFRSRVYCDLCGYAIERTVATPGLWGCRYGCAGGNLTIGYGTSLEVGIIRSEASALLIPRLAAAADAIKDFSWYARLSTARLAALIDMVYTLGQAGFANFAAMHAALERGDYAAAADAILDSEWAREQAPARAKEDAALMRTGQLQ